jgi:(p)ppGpp synthase/HD superfamily hydrolase
MNLEDAIGMATLAHNGQKDKTGQPVILHPLRVMMAMPNDELRIVAVLHDIVEDTCWTVQELEQTDLGPQIVKALDAISHRKGETNVDYIYRCKLNPLAKQVKLADIHDNASPLRQMGLTEETRQRLKEKYEVGLRILLEE